MFTYGFYDSLNGDRKYDAMQMSSIFDGIIEDGVYANVGEALMVVPGTGLQVIVKTGRAWFKHTWNLNDSYMPLEIEEPDLYRTRIDAVVIEVDRNLSVRANSIKVVKGTAATTPSKPAMKHEEGIDQYALAYVTVDSEATAIVESKIEIAVGKNETPFVQCPLKTVSIEDLFNQWNGEFDEWFNNLKAQLTENVVTNLQNQIDDRVKISDKATEDDIKNGTEGKWVDAKNMKDASRYLSATVGEIVESPGVNLEKLYPEKFKELNQQVIKDPPEYLKEKYFRPTVHTSVLEGVAIPANLVPISHYNMTFEHYELFLGASVMPTLYIYDKDTGTVEIKTLTTGAANAKPIFGTIWRGHLFYITGNGYIIRYTFGEWSSPTIVQLIWDSSAGTGISNFNNSTTEISELTFDGDYISFLFYKDKTNGAVYIARSRDLFTTYKCYKFETGFYYTVSGTTTRMPLFINSFHIAPSQGSGVSSSHIYKYNGKNYLIGLSPITSSNTVIIWELDLGSSSISAKKILEKSIDGPLIGFSSGGFAALACDSKLVIFGNTTVQITSAMLLPGIFTYDIDTKKSSATLEYDRKGATSVGELLKFKPIVSLSPTLEWVCLSKIDGEYYIVANKAFTRTVYGTGGQSPAFQTTSNTLIKISLDFKKKENLLGYPGYYNSNMGNNDEYADGQQFYLDGIFGATEESTHSGVTINDLLTKSILYDLETANPYDVPSYAHGSAGRKLCLIDVNTRSFVVLWLPFLTTTTTTTYHIRDSGDRYIMVWNGGANSTQIHTIMKNEMVLPYKPGSYIAVQ